MDIFDGQSYDPNKIRFLPPFLCSPYIGEESARNLVSSFNSSLTFRFMFNQTWTVLPLPSCEFLLYSPLPSPVSRYRSLALIQAFEKNSPLVSFFYNPSFTQVPEIVILKYRPDQKSLWLRLGGDTEGLLKVKSKLFHMAFTALPTVVPVFTSSVGC